MPSREIRIPFTGEEVSDILGRKAHEDGALPSGEYSLSMAIKAGPDGKGTIELICKPKS